MMLAIFVVPVAVQALAMLVDEIYFHRRRELPRWERLGHPIDTLTIVVCLGWLLIATPGDSALGVYVGLAIASTLVVTKDKWVHARLCTAGEQWLHSVLFAVHPVVLAAFAYAWWYGRTDLLLAQLVVTVAFGWYQLVYWNLVEPARRRREINNAWYADLGTRWYTADDTPIALLRAESRHRNPWIANELERELGPGACDIVDLGCGAGFLSNYLGEQGHVVTGIDTTDENLVVARAHDSSGRVTYQSGDACALPFPDASFDAVCAMDLLEHVEDPARLVAEASRVLRPGGLLFFHTFNRTWIANLIVIKGVELFVANTPNDLHLLRMFITPDELRAMCATHGLDITCLRGSRPRFRWPLWRMLFTRRVGDDFAFTFTTSTAIGYTGYARKLSAPRPSASPPPVLFAAHEQPDRELAR